MKSVIKTSHDCSQLQWTSTASRSSNSVPEDVSENEQSSKVWETLKYAHQCLTRVAESKKAVNATLTKDKNNRPEKSRSGRKKRKINILMRNLRTKKGNPQKTDTLNSQFVRLLLTVSREMGKRVFTKRILEKLFDNKESVRLNMSAMIEIYRANSELFDALPKPKSGCCTSAFCKIFYASPEVRRFHSLMIELLFPEEPDLTHFPWKFAPDLSEEDKAKTWMGLKEYLLETLPQGLNKDKPGREQNVPVLRKTTFTERPETPEISSPSLEYEQDPCYMLCSPPPVQEMDITG